MELFLKTNSSNPYHSPEKTLSELANQFETDKGTSDSVNLSWGAEYATHRSWQYSTTYEKYMNSSKNGSISMLEIGVCDKRFPYASI